MARDKLYIGGKWVSATSGAQFDDHNPSSGEVWAQPAEASAADAEIAVEAAAAVAPEWAAISLEERAKLMNAAAAELEKRKGDVAEALGAETGSAFAKRMFEASFAPGNFRAAAALPYQVAGELLPSEHGKVSMLERVPVGVVSVVSPWNFPLLLSTRVLAGPVALGNTIVLKPSEEAPYTGGLLVAEVFEAVGIPPGVLNVVTTSREKVEEVGEVLVSHDAIGAVSFTGSEVVGRKLAARAGENLKKISLELGGKDALIVLRDADLEKAAHLATFGAFMHQGQICMSVERLIVDEEVADAFTEKFVARVRKLKVGPTTEKENQLGPLINAKQAERVHAQVNEALKAGARALIGGKHRGLFYEPTVLVDVKPDMAIWRDETFGPIAPIVRVRDEDEAIALANDTRYGLSSGVVTQDEERGLRVARQLETGMCHINDSPVNDEPHVPFGGVKAGGMGRYGGRATIETFTRTRWLTIEKGGRGYPPGF